MLLIIFSKWLQRTTCSETCCGLVFHPEISMTLVTTFTTRFILIQLIHNDFHFSQMLAECKKRSPSFNRLLAIHEDKPICANRSLETFLTLPMHRVPNYIITLHRILAFTPPDHVDRKSLEHAQGVLEELSMVRQR